MSIAQSLYLLSESYMDKIIHDLSGLKEDSINTLKNDLRKSIYDEYKDVRLKEISKLTDDKLHKVSINKQILVDYCIGLFIRNFQWKGNKVDLIEGVEHLVNEFIGITDLDLSKYHNNVPELSEEIFTHCIIEFVGDTFINAVDESQDTKTKEIIKKQILSKVLAQLDTNNNYEEFIKLSKDGDEFSLPIIKCLISLEPQEDFIARLEIDAKLRDTIFNFKDEFDRNILHYAAAKGKELIVEQICKLDSKDKLVQAKDGYGRTSAHLAAMHNYEWPLERGLIKKSQDLYLEDNFGRNIFHISAMYNAVRVVKFCIEMRGEIIESLEGKTKDNIIHLAAKFNSLDVLNYIFDSQDENLLLKLENQKNKHGSTPLHHAAYYRNNQVVDFLLQYNASPNLTDNDRRYPILVALKYNKDLVDQNSREDAIILKKKTIATLLNYDYGIFVASGADKENWRDKSNELELNFRKISQYKEKKGDFKDFFYEVEDESIFTFTKDLLKFLQDHPDLFPPKLSKYQEHLPIAFRIIKTKNQEVLKEFLEKFPEFEFSLNDVLLRTVGSNIKDYEFAIDILISKGADPLLIDEYGDSVISDALRHGNIELVKKLFSKIEYENLSEMLGEEDLKFCENLALNVLKGKSEILSLLHLDNNVKGQTVFINNITDCYEMLGGDSCLLFEEV